MALGLLLIMPAAQAQDTLGSAEAFYIISGFVLLVSILVLAVAIVVLQVLRVFVRRELEAKGVVEEKKAPWWKKFLTKANDAVPVEEEQTVMLDHNYDGIRELDNHLPPWWKWLFYVTIIFAVAYLLLYHVFGTMPLQIEEYQAEMAVAEKAQMARMADQPVSNIDESNVTYLDDPDALADGAKIFKMNCAACHKEDGGGGIGPNLTDQYWLHGGSIKDIFKTIKNGVPDKGMISWESMLSPDKIQNVASYVKSLQGTTPANPKEPQGELYEPEQKEEGKEEAPADSTQMASVNNE